MSKKIYNKPEIRPFIDSPERLEKADWIEWPDCVWDNWSDSSDKNINKNLMYSGDYFSILKNPKLNSNSVLRKEIFGGLLFNQDSRFIIQLNNIAYDLLNLSLTGGKNYAVTEMSKEYQMDLRTVETDYDKIMKQLYERGVFE